MTHRIFTAHPPQKTSKRSQQADAKQKKMHHRWLMVRELERVAKVVSDEINVALEVKDKKSRGAWHPITFRC